MTFLDVLEVDGIIWKVVRIQSRNINKTPPPPLSFCIFSATWMDAEAAAWQSSRGLHGKTFRYYSKSEVATALLRKGSGKVLKVLEV